MKRTQILLFFISCVLGLNAQSWFLSNSLKGSSDLNIVNTTSSIDGGAIILGFFTGTIEESTAFELHSNGGRDYFIAKFSENGKLDWLNQLGGSLDEYVTGNIVTSGDGSVYVTGGFQDKIFYTETDSITSSSASDIFLAKYDASGNIIWCKNFGSGVGNQYPVALNIVEDNHLLVTGVFRDSVKFETQTLFGTIGRDNIFYGKFDSDGIPVWVKKIVGINTTNPGRINSVALTSDSYVFSGYFRDSINLDGDTIVSLSNSLDNFLFKTDFSGTKDWINLIKGESTEVLVTSISDPENNVYVSGYYNSSSLIFESVDNAPMTIDINNGEYDIYTAKYNIDGNIDWARSNGSKYTERILTIEYFNDAVHIGGSFSDTLQWGGLEVKSNGPLDKDMFYGSLNNEGNYREVNRFSGRNNSTEEAWGLFYNQDNLFTVLRSNSDLLVLGDSIYTNPSQNYFIAVGTIGCLPINITSSKTDVTGCYADETGSIFIGASGGFGGPFRYSINNGDTYQDNDPNFTVLPAGTYPTLVADIQNCTQSGPDVIIDEPDTLMITNVASEDALCYGGDGSITIEASGGTGNVFFSTDGGSNYSYAVGTATNLPEGTYSISVSDANDCITDLDSSLVIEQPDELTITLESSADITDGADGEIVVSAAGGTNPYSFTINPSAGTQNPDTIFTFSAGEGGDYIVEVDDANNCGPASTSTITISDLTNISNPDILNASIYPNPSSGMVTVEFNTDKAEMTMEVFSIDGRNVMSRQVYSAGGQLKETLDLSSLDKGMYIIRVDQQTLSSAVVIN